MLGRQSHTGFIMNEEMTEKNNKISEGMQDSIMNIIDDVSRLKSGLISFYIMFHVEKIMFHAWDGFFLERAATMKIGKQNKK